MTARAQIVHQDGGVVLGMASAQHVLRDRRKALQALKVLQKTIARAAVLLVGFHHQAVLLHVRNAQKDGSRTEQARIQIARSA